MFRRLAWKAAAGIAAMALGHGPAMAQVPVGSAFTYQGSLFQDGAAVSENCDFQFRLWNDPVAGAPVGAAIALNNVPVDGGHFAAQLDFGAAAFGGQARWLEISVRRPAGVGPWQTLTPRQALTPAPYAIGLSLPFQGIADQNLGGAFEIINNDMGWAGVFRNNNPANTDAALNVTSMGGPAGQFFNDAGGLAISARSIANGTAIYADAPGVGNDAKSIHGLIALPNGGLNSAAVRGENLSLSAGAAGVWGSNVGAGYGVRGQSLSGRGVFGETTSDFGFGVYGSGAGRSGIGVYGIHPSPNGDAPGVDGVTQSFENGATGVRGRATSAQTSTARTFGVLGTSNSILGVGVRGESNTGVEADGDQYGVFATASNIGGHAVHGEGTYGIWGRGNDGGAGVRGEAGNSSTFGVWAVGGGGRLGAPALRADGNTGPAIYALGSRAIEGEGTEFGVRGVTWEETGVGGTFTNYADGGVALRVNGRAEVQGTLSVNVLEIQGGADLAERFPFSEAAEPGMVVAIDPDQPGRMRVSREAYDKRVAGVISGANGLSAGVVLGDEPGSDRNLPIALNGRVWVKCDTRARGVKAGDLMTTSDRAGFAMPVIDREKADGAIIGKAMTELAEGEQGMVLVLVNLR
ncbi:MAG: hypothetical protein AMXMBFR47_14850 [Planctomycetota bacterium]